MARKKKLTTILKEMENSQTYHIEISHDGLNKYQVIRGKNKFEVQQKAQAKIAEWDASWQRKLELEKLREEREKIAEFKEKKKVLAEEETNLSQQKLQAIENLLVDSLSKEHKKDWDKLLNNQPYSEPEPDPPTITPMPDPKNPKYKVPKPLWDYIFTENRRKKEETANELYLNDYNSWKQNQEKNKVEYEVRIAKHNQDTAEYERMRIEYNDNIQKQKEAFFKNDPVVVAKCFSEVIEYFEYPINFTKSNILDLDVDNHILIIDYDLPSQDNIPTVAEVRYIVSKNEFSEKHISQVERSRLFDSAIYQICLRTIFEIFDADINSVLHTIVFNGFVTSIDPATGQQARRCILSLQANKDEFLNINLANVDPKTCFKGLKGISGTKLSQLTPIAPIMQINREDARFIDGYLVAANIDERTNLAAMDWEDFEHLIRELFEQEFLSSGGEVKVTRASRDGGIDAVAFDPDPIRGGKIVIQAKRYTNTVGVSAVRDLYGAVINEGAAKGILVTTSNYGSDSYEFAKGKPLTLLNGNNLLHLLEKHGHRAKIDIQEAKRLLKEQ